MTELSIVIPVYGCGESLRELHRRLRASIEPLTPHFELIFVDDRSPDDSFRILGELAAGDPAVRVVRLSRNFGEHAAVTAGLAKSSGRFAVILDCDLQDPPEEIPRLLGKAREGYDIVFSRRTERGQGFARRLASRVYYRLLNFLLKTGMDAERGSLTVLSRKVVDALVGMQDKEYKLALEWLGFERTTIDLPRTPRPHGGSSYSLGSLFRVAVDGIFFQSTRLLRWIVYLGFVVASIGAVLAVYFVYWYFTSENPEPGWTSVAVLLLLLGGFMIISTGIAALYVGRIFDRVKQRPLYVVDAELRSPGGGPEELSEHEAIRP